MTARYAIADYLTREAREAAAAAVYDNTETPGIPFPRTSDTCSCPLGIALAVMFGRASEAPDAATVARMIGGDEAAVLAAAAAFIDDWDSGVITDLRTAFGLDEAGVS